MFLLASCLAVFFVLPVALSDSLKIPANLNDLNPPTDFRIIDRQLGELTFSWNDSLSEDVKNNAIVKYIFVYKYFDSHTWENDYRLMTTTHTEKFELHRGVYVRVKNVLLDKRKKVMKESNWTVKDIQPPPGVEETSVFNFSCLVYDISYVNCTWNIGNKAPSDTQYLMYYRQDQNTMRCTQYFTDVQGRHGCHIDQGRIDLEENVLICVNGSSRSATILPYYIEFDPQHYEMYNPPINVEVLPNRTVKWDKPPGYAINNECFEYQLKVTDLSDNFIELISVSGETKYILVNNDPTRRYSVKIRVMLKHCKETKFWSNWSNEVFIEPKHPFNVTWTPHIFALIAIPIGLLLLIAFRRYKLLEVISKPIPDPQKKFKELFEEYNGDFQKWIGYQIPISKAEECHPVIIEESPTIEA
ncbi:interleukin-5 receptor subunit alpha-like [Heptranchias perlo]|uniref:interleukin-5 receptor subunit alpha-like n=1 Tax=Heptranchias perlo TaxID=212740 RepID=UPI00355A3429